MLKIGITGQSGFLGTHLYNTLNILNDKFQTIPFYDDYFNNTIELQKFVKQCDIIIHLAALNRHNSPDTIYETNIKLVKQIIDSCVATDSKPHIMFSSSIQEERDNMYGKSKKEGRLLFEKWAYENSARFTGLIIPNIFGPFGIPYYNSVVATFCHQLTHNETPKIDVDGELNLIYVGELVKDIIQHIHSVENNKINYTNVTTLRIKHTFSIKVSKLLETLRCFKTMYIEHGIIPDLSNSFERNLFNTFVCYIDKTEFFPFKLKLNSDNRGTFVETIKLNSGGQISFSTTLPGITRGNHFHIRKAERFVVIKGKARIDIRRIGTEQIFSYEIDGSQPAFVDMPIWFTHNITNIGNEDLYTIFWISEHFDPSDPDTFYEEV